MTCINESGPAFPSDSHQYGPAPGMTLRDYFAAKAMQSAQSDPSIVMLLGPKPNADAVAEYAYWVADAMLAERAK